jgi:MOSC domain-containing protein YiiM
MVGSLPEVVPILSLVTESGRIEAIYLRPASGAPAQAAVTARLQAGRGIEADRYFFPAGAAPGEALTLIAAEALEGLRADTGIELAAAESRRQIVTRGIDLNALVGREFLVGGVRCLGVELCEPCAHLQAVTTPGVLRGLVHRGGLRADVLTAGEIAVGDAVGASREG